jgi:type I restriction enzyme, S subunit
MRWPEVELSDIAATQYGFTASASKEAIGPKFLRITDIVRPSINWDTVPFCKIDEASHEKYLLTPGDIVVARTGATTGYAKLIRDEVDAVFASYLVRFQITDRRALKGFIGLAMESNPYKSFIRSTVGGAAQPNANARMLAKFRVKLPPLSLQNRIVSVASAYDDLSRNNLRRIALLDEAARLLYREWFVHLRFPGHEHVKVVNGLPHGWRRESLSNLADDVSYGFTASADQQIEGPKFVRITDIVDGPIDWEHVPRCAISAEEQVRFLLSPGDIVVARTGATTGWARRVGRHEEPAVFASYLVRFQFSTKYRREIAAIYMQSDDYKAFIKANVGGAAQPNAGAKVLGSATVPVPTDALQDRFAELIAPMLDQIDILTDQNRKLAEARDLLLPRLMSGEIGV